MYYLIETKETFSAPTSSATNCSFKKRGKQLPKKRKHVRKTMNTLCLDRHCGTFQEADFKERVEQIENKVKPANVVAASFDNSLVLLKLKIVFNLCLCSFSKNKEQINVNLNSYKTKDEDFSIFFQFIISSCVAKMFSAPLIYGNQFCFFQQHKKRDIFYSFNSSWNSSHDFINFKRKDVGILKLFISIMLPNLLKRRQLQFPSN